MQFLVLHLLSASLAILTVLPGGGCMAEAHTQQVEDGKKLARNRYDERSCIRTLMPLTNVDCSGLLRFKM